MTNFLYLPLKIHQAAAVLFRRLWRYRRIGSSVLVGAAAASFALCPYCVFGKDNDSSAGKSVKINGVVTKISEFPDPSKSSYPDCFYTILLKARGAGDKEVEYLVLLKCFEKFSLIPGNIVKPGEHLHIEAVPFDDLPESEQAIQRTDDIERFDLECYVASKVSRVHVSGGDIPAGTKIDNRKKAAAFIPPPPIPEHIRRAAKKFIEDDKAVISKKLASRERRGEIRLEYLPGVREKRAALKKQPKINHFLFWSGDSLIWAPAKKDIILKPPSSVTIDSINAKDVLIAFDRELKKRNIRFIFVSFPSMEEIYYAHFAKNVSPEESFDVQRLKVLKYLLDNNVEIIDLGDLFSRRFSDFPFFQDIIRNDPHPMTPAVTILADELVRRLSPYEWSSYRLPSELFKTAWTDNHFKTEYPSGNDKFRGICQVEQYSIDKSCRKKESPIFILGDSFSITPWKSGGIGSCLACRLHLPVKTFSNQGGKGQLARSMSACSYRLLSEKQVVIMVVIGGEFSGRWAPLVSQDGKKIFELSRSEIPKSWQGVVRKGDRFRISAARDKKNALISRPYEIPLEIGGRNKRFFIEIKPCTRGMSFELLNSSDTPVAASAPSGHEEDSVIIRIPPSYFKDNHSVRLRLKCTVGNLSEIEIKDMIVLADDI